MDLFGFEVEEKEDGEIVRYDKVGNVVDEQLFEEKLQQEEMLEKQGVVPVKRMKRFLKPDTEIDL